MESLIDVIRIYFRKVSSYNILKGNLNYRAFKKADFDALSLLELKDLSETETNELYHYLEDGIGTYKKETGLHVFRLLKLATRQYLSIRENQPVCVYDRILEWRELTKNIGEDFAICAFLADRTEITKYEWEDFEWGAVVGHDNVQLNALMKKGISDNHFHLFGSAPVFKLIWIQLMNRLDNPKYRSGLLQIDAKKRQTRNKYSMEYSEDTLEKMHFQAALIRAVLFYYIRMVKCKNHAVIKKIHERIKEIQGLLISDFSYQYKKSAVQNFINSLGMMNAFIQNDKTGDYANLGYCPRSINHEFEGERAFMYQMMLGKIDNVPIPDIMMNWFYAYMVIQIKFREELLQVNDTIGFENFSQYTDRKNLFLYTNDDDRKMVQHAVCGSFEAGNLKKLEVRISPWDSAESNAVQIRNYEQYLKRYREENAEKQIYYVFHFPKRKDDEVSQRNGILPMCRHGRFRRVLERKAEQLVRFREMYPEEAQKVLGIDACAKEIGCRPEVFASVFRLLANHVAYNPMQWNVKQWKRTYHVGEDWLDVVDGLRAIDEAILFLEMTNGDRLGHATVLGIDINSWYKRKRNNICLPLQDYLDNIVWLYHKLLDFGIEDSETLKGYLQIEFDRCFKKLYEKYICKKTFHYGIEVYYQSWKLRGDNPELYQKREYDKTLSYLCPHWINEQVVNGQEIRNQSAVVELLHMYHYLAEVRVEGESREPVRIPEFYVEGVRKVQRAMQKYVAQKGIFVETNPSSNLLISTMNGYAEHPIVNLYNMGLTWNEQELKDCPQIHVSINTDDKGVFYTSLENEFALMGCALEQVQDGNGEQKYQKQMVYQWLEQIRENGNQQSFLQ